MKTLALFEKHFSTDNLENLYSEHIVLSRAIGIDKVSHPVFETGLVKSLKLINKKSLNGTHQFTKYKLKLISKGRNKCPREISIPTIRDRLLLRALCGFLTEKYKNDVVRNLPQHVVSDTKKSIQSGKFNHYIKLDIKDFYPSIRHDELARRLGKKIRDPHIKDLIAKAIQTPTVSQSSIDSLDNTKGVPQGLSISNILASIYFINIDKRYSSMSNIKYYRYVDDILILCRDVEALPLYKDLRTRFKRLGLTLYDPFQNNSKSSIGMLNEEFSYLGYKYQDGKITVRDQSLAKLRESLVAIFTSYKHAKKKNEKFLLWRLNIRIAGCVFKDKSRGWMYFFSEIDDLSVLHRLDHYVDKLCTNFGLSLDIKRFVKSYFEINKNRYQTNYIPNFDNYSIEQKKKVLVEVFSMRVSKFSNSEIDLIFRSKIDKQVKELLIDFVGFGIS